jgi:hypothetical protein
MHPDRQQERVITKPEQFQPFDLKALRQLASINPVVESAEGICATNRLIISTMDSKLT